MDKPLFIINSVAPIRICDNGGWTDTWFAGHGQIFNIGVYPYAEVQIAVFPNDGRPSQIVINAENYGERYVIIPEKHWDKHPLLEAAIEYMHLPSGMCLEVTIYSEAPGGASTGTSAAVTVALVGGLDLLTPGRMTRTKWPAQPTRSRPRCWVSRAASRTSCVRRTAALISLRCSSIRMLRCPHPDPKCHLVGIGAKTFTGLPWKVASVLGCARDGDPVP